MKFVSLDFETANKKRGSVCQVGLAVFEAGSLIESKSWLVKPYNNYFDDINVHIHGITGRDVADAPGWNSVWMEVKSYLHKSLIVAHNASFDISVLRHVLDIYSIPYPTLEYICSYRFAQKVWGNLMSYRLSYLSGIFDIDLNHHDAHSDAIAAGRILLKGMEALNVSTYQELRDILRLKPGSVFERSYTTPKIKGVPGTIKKLKLRNNYEGQHTFKDKTVAFTGALDYISRKKAQKLVEHLGGSTKNSVSKKVDILIVGESDIKKYGAGYKTNKLKKAEELLNSGHTIKLLGEDEFLSFCHWAENKISLFG